MTIIQNNNLKSNNEYKILVASLIAVLMVLSIGGIFVYNLKVNLSHEIASVKDSLRDAEIKNADLKNSVYGMLDQQKLQTLAANQGLVIDKDPEYVKTQANSVAMLSAN